MYYIYVSEKVKLWLENIIKYDTHKLDENIISIIYEIMSENSNSKSNLDLDIYIKLSNIRKPTNIPTSHIKYDLKLIDSYLIEIIDNNR